MCLFVIDYICLSRIDENRKRERRNRKKADRKQEETDYDRL
jgi:hypothetical protein